MIAAQRHQLEVLQGTKKQRAADLEAAKAILAAAQLKLGYTKIIAPFDGVVPLPNVYVIANYKETQLTHTANSGRGAMPPRDIGPRSLSSLSAIACIDAGDH